MENYRFNLPIQAYHEISLDVSVDKIASFKFVICKDGVTSKINTYELRKKMLDSLLKGLSIENFTYFESIGLIVGFSFQKLSMPLDKKYPSQKELENFLKEMLNSCAESKKYNLEIYTDGFDEYSANFRELNKRVEANNLTSHKESKGVNEINERINSLKISNKIQFDKANYEVITSDGVFSFGKKTFIRLNLICDEIFRRMNDPKNSLPFGIDGEDCVALFTKEVIITNETNLSHIFSDPDDKKMINQFASLKNNRFQLK